MKFVTMMRCLGLQILTQTGVSTLKKLFRVPSPSAGISLLALFIALTGTAYAATLPRNSVSTKQLKKNAVTSSKIKTSGVLSSDVKNDALTGSDINESTLATVPNATNATNATNAASVNGSNVVKINYRGDDGSAPVEIFDAGGLKLSAGCAASVPTFSASTSTDNAFIRAGINTFENVTAVNEGVISTYHEDDFFDIATPFNMLLGWNVLAGDLEDSTQGTFTYAAAGGTVVTATYLVEYAANSFGGTADCFVIGNAVVAR